MDSDLEAMHTRMYALLRWQTYIEHFIKSLEHPAPNNIADKHKLDCIMHSRYKFVCFDT